MFYDEWGEKHVINSLLKSADVLSVKCKVFVCSCYCMEWLFLCSPDVWGWIHLWRGSKYAGIRGVIQEVAAGRLRKAMFRDISIKKCDLRMQNIYQDLHDAEIIQLENKPVRNLRDNQRLQFLYEHRDANPCNSLEDAAARILSFITDGCGFWVTKSLLGPCWQIDCCKWPTNIHELYPGKYNLYKHFGYPPCKLAVYPRDWRGRIKKMISGISEHIHTLRIMNKEKCAVDFMDMLQELKFGITATQGDGRTSVFSGM